MPLRLSLGLRNAAAAILLLTSATACLSGTEPSSTPSNPAAETYAAALGVNIAGMTKVSNDLYVQDLVVGTGATAAAGSAITATYSGWLTSGYLFDTNVGKTALSFTVGAVPGVIDGWNLGVVGMKAGGKRRLVIGSNLGYGGAANGPIPANSTLVFDVTVLTVK